MDITVGTMLAEINDSLVQTNILLQAILSYLENKRNAEATLRVLEKSGTATPEFSPYRVTEKTVPLFPGNIHTPTPEHLTHILVHKDDNND